MVGKYVIVRVGDAGRDEWTNVGVLVFDAAGTRVYHKMGPFERAVARGDLDADHVHLLTDCYCDTHTTLAEVEATIEGHGHCTALAQFTDPRATILDAGTGDNLHERYVLARR